LKNLRSDPVGKNGERKHKERKRTQEKARKMDREMERR
jgi:hypothetical protein